MGDITKGRTFVSGETATPEKFNTAFDDAVIAAGAVTTSKVADANITGPKVAAGFVIQTLSSTSGTNSTITTSFPCDNTIPQNTEGGEVLTLAITPAAASNKVLVRVVVNGTTTAAGDWGAGLFRDSVAGALVAGRTYGATYGYQVVLEYLDSPATTSAVTYKVRAGGDGINFFFNGRTAANGMFGGVCLSSITVQEIKG